MSYLPKQSFFAGYFPHSFIFNNNLCKMLSSGTKKSSYLFQVLLDPEELDELILIDQSLLKQFIRHCAKQFSKILHKCNTSACIFLANYKQIMEKHCQKVSSTLSVNIALHFALLFTQHLLSEDKETYAKEILKQTEEYLDMQDCDLPLLSICMNNLAILQKKGGKYRKSLNTSLEGIGLMEEHLDQLHLSRNKKRIVEDGVIFVNLLLIAKGNIRKILQQEHHDGQLYRRLLAMLNKLGYNFSSKYFGSESYFTSKFQHNQSTIDLPVYDESVTLSEPQQNDFQVKISQELANIYNIIKDINFTPEVYYIRQNIVQEKEVTEVVQIVQPSIVQPQRSISWVEHLIVDDWDAELSIMRSSSLSLQSDYDFLGHLQFKIAKNKKRVEKLIKEDDLFKMLNAMSIYDVLPYQMQLKRLSGEDFIKRLLIHFMAVTNNGELKIYPKARPVIPPFQFTFCGEKSFIFVNHIRFRRYRVAISPVNSCDSVYLQLDFRHKQIYSMVKFKEIQHQKISKLSKKYHLQEQYGQQQYQYSTHKSIQLIGNQLQIKVCEILKQFQTFLAEQEQNKLEEMTTLTNLNDDYLYYQYTEYKQSIGQFHIIKYRNNANHYQINAKNTFKTYTPSGEDYARGTIVYSPQQFLKDFSVNLKQSRRHIAAFSEIILQKFTLKIYQNPLMEEQEDIFEENAITEVPITSKCFYRKFLSFEDYQLPVTIQIVAINNQKPVGIRVTAYQPIKGNNSGLFIHITPEYWQRPIPKGQQEDEGVNVNVKRSTEDYNFKKCYFLTNWMEQEGFKRIFDRLIINNRALQMRGINSKFIRLDDLLKD